MERQDAWYGLHTLTRLGVCSFPAAGFRGFCQIAVPFILFGLTVLPGSAAGQTLGLVSSFFAAAVAVPLVTCYLLKRPWWSVGFPERRIDWLALGSGMAVGLVVGLASTLIFAALGLLQIRLQTPDPGAWLMLLAVAGVGLLIQTGTEELMYRGYLTQFVRRYTTSPILFIGVPALIFSAMHIGNVAVFSGHWYALLPYLVSALLYAWFAYRTGALWTAIGLHWANNLGNSVLVGTEIDVIPSLAPVIIEHPSFVLVLGVTVFGAVLTFVVLESVIRRQGKQQGRRRNLDLTGIADGGAVACAGLLHTTGQGDGSDASGGAVNPHP